MKKAFLQQSGKMSDLRKTSLDISFGMYSEQFLNSIGENDYSAVSSVFNGNYRQHSVL
jgi:hypothetical protein